MLTKIKRLLIIGSLLLIVVIVIILLGKRVSSRTSSNTIPVTPTPLAVVSSPLEKSNIQIATEAKKNLLPKLPIKVADFPTSVGINTDIFISSYADDNPEVVRIEIYGPNYQYNQNDPQTNPNMIAFKESFEKAVSLLTANGAKVSDLHISLSNKKYIREIAESWIKTLNLLP